MTGFAYLEVTEELEFSNDFKTIQLEIAYQLKRIADALEK